MNKLPDKTTISPPHDAPADTTRLTFKVVVFAVVAFVIAPLILACLYTTGNFYTRMEQWYAMNISLQSIDPTRLAIDDPEEDIAILESLVSPKLRSEGFARALHARWKADRLWAIREGVWESFDMTRTTADGVVVFKTDMATAEGMHYRDVRETLHWEKIDGTWYLADLKDETADDRFVPWPGVILPERRGSPGR